MKNTVKKNELIDVLTIGNKLKGGNLSICNGVVITFGHNGNTTFQMTDLQTSYVKILGISNHFKMYNNPVNDSNSVIVSKSALIKAVKAIPKRVTETSLELLYDDDGSIWGLRVNDTISMVKAGVVDDFPMTPKYPFKSLVAEPGARGCNVLTVQALQKTACVGTAADERRAHIIGILLDFEKGRMVSTDGSRLHVHKMPKANYPDTIIEKKFVSLFLTKQLKNTFEKHGKVLSGGVVVKDNNLFVDVGNGYICHRILEGSFPEIDGIINVEVAHVLAMSDKTSFVDDIKEAMAILSVDYRGIILTLNKKVTIEATNPDIGEFKKHYACEFTYAGEKLKSAYNPGYLLAALGCIDDKGANLEFVNEDSFLYIEQADREFLAAVMPMR